MFCVSQITEDTAPQKQYMALKEIDLKLTFCQHRSSELILFIVENSWTNNPLNQSRAFIIEEEGRIKKIKKSLKKFLAHSSNFHCSRYGSLMAER